MRWHHAGIQVLGAHISDLAPVRVSAWAALSDAERSRIESLTDAAADEVLLGRHLVRSLAGEMLGIPPADVELVATCRRCGAEHGRPTVPAHPLLVTITHSGGLVLAAVAETREVSAIGIDTEPVSRADHAALRRWTQFEAVAKAEGHGIRDDLDPERTVGYRTWSVPTPTAITTLAWRSR